MSKKITELLKSINDGKVSGSQRKLAKMLNVSEVSVSSWISKNKKPSEENILKMTKIFNKSQDELENIFTENLEEGKAQTLAVNKKLLEENKFLKERIKFLEEQVAFYKEKLSEK